MSTRKHRRIEDTGATDPRSEPHRRPRHPPTSSSTTNSINILIVDDEPRNLTVLETVLEDPGYRLVRAESAEQALLALVAEEFALLMLDIQMPGMSGFELAQMIKQRKKTAGVPIIFLTAYYSEDQHVLEGYGTGAVDYLHKPINPTILRSKVAVFAELHRKSRESARANQRPASEVAARRRAEEQLRQLNDELERRVAERTGRAGRRPTLRSSGGQHAGHLDPALTGELRYVFVNSAIETGRLTWSEESFSVDAMRPEASRDARSSPHASLWEARPRSVFETEDAASIEFDYACEFRVVRPDGSIRWATRLVSSNSTPAGEAEFVLGADPGRHRPEACRGSLEKRRPAEGRVPGHSRPRTSKPARSHSAAGSMCSTCHETRPSPSDTREMMDRQLSHMVRLIDDLLDVSRITSGKLTLRKERVSLRTVVETAVEASRPVIEASGHALKLALPEEPLWLDADPTRLAQVMSNLLTNAAKYTPEGGCIELAAAREGGEVIVRVTDTGLGIPPGMLAEVFEMFTQVNRTLERSQGGLGIGLALVKRLVELHGGTITAESPGLGQGSTFTVRLPLVEA